MGTDFWMTACGTPSSAGMTLVVRQAAPGADVHADHGASRALPAFDITWAVSEGHYPSLHPGMDF